VKKDDFFQIVENAHRRNLDLMSSKGAAYSGSDDVFANFKRNADRLGLTQYQVWLVYFLKHIDAITNAVKTNPDHPVDKSEGLEGRVDDAENYLKLLRGMLAESSGNVSKTKTYKPFPVDSADRHFFIPKHVEYRLPKAEQWHFLEADTELRKFPVGTDFRTST
jgi:hypothetical protein